MTSISDIKHYKQNGDTFGYPKRRLLFSDLAKLDLNEWNVIVSIHINHITLNPAKNTFLSLSNLYTSSYSLNTKKTKNYKSKSKYIYKINDEKTMNMIKNSSNRSKTI